MTRGELLNFLVEEAKKYRGNALASIARNKRMNGLTPNDTKRLRNDPLLFQRFTDALLVDFINTIAVGQCVDYGLYTKHIQS